MQVLDQVLGSQIFNDKIYSYNIIVKELDSMIFMGPFQLKTFYDFVSLMARIAFRAVFVRLTLKAVSISMKK